MIYYDMLYLNIFLLILFTLGAKPITGINFYTFKLLYYIAAIRGALVNAR